MPADLHPDLGPLEPLLGTWVGRGAGEYPTIEPFEYFEEVVFSHVGKPFLVYGHTTRAADDGRPLHAEAGYLRVPQPGHAELVLAHPSGIAEIELGTYSVRDDAVHLELATTTIGLTPTAKEVTAITRSFSVAGDELSHSLRMAAVGQPLQHHVAALLHRQR
ncbi:peroxynitrite isomerase [Mycobacterium gastri]|uniref:Peroxynitrite isomerase n=1 Tax=Mycobacterium gastri TaxID=1777 RepID=A0A1X1VHS8_MYCGS|nr:FABP family protein [Mycobacterium gastri]ETW25088.1 fatty acid-binding protein [Mycobacterium gastri 'Wayne']ORV68567.1 fatty acid-binding-like protein [Mycobacterium gastri]